MNIPLYIQHAPTRLEGEPQIWIDAFLNKLLQSILVFEIGSGTGRDAEYIEQKGYKMIRTDIHQEFVDYQKKTYDKQAYIYDITKDILPAQLSQKFDAVLVRSVLNHFSADEIKKLLKTLNSRLNIGGYIAFNITKEFNVEDLKKFLMTEKLVPDYEQTTEDEPWVYLICKKIS